MLCYNVMMRVGLSCRTVQRQPPMRGRRWANYGFESWIMRGVSSFGMIRTTPYYYHKQLANAVGFCGIENAPERLRPIPQSVDGVVLLLKLVIIQQLCELFLVELGNKALLHFRTCLIALQTLTQFIEWRGKHIKLNLEMVADIQGIGKNNRLIYIDEEELNCLKRRFYTAEGNGNEVWARLLTVELFDIFWNSLLITVSESQSIAGSKTSSMTFKQCSFILTTCSLLILYKF